MDKNIARSASAQKTDDISLEITVWPDFRGTNCEQHATTWKGFGDWLEAQPEYPSKSRCPLVKLATFGDQRTVSDSLRHNGNIKAVYGLEGDYDAGDVPPETARDTLERLGLAALIVTTPSHGLPEKGNRWRVFVPLSRPVSVSERKALVARLNGVLGDILARESFTASQAFYIGRVSGVDYKVLRSDGLPIDQVPNLEPLPEAGTPDAGFTGAVDSFLLKTKEARGGTEQVAAALELIPNDEPDWHQWNRTLMAVYRATNGSDEGLSLAKQWSEKCAVAGPTDNVDARWKSYRRSPPTEIGAGTLIEMAGGYNAVAGKMEAMFSSAQESVDSSSGGYKITRAFELSEEAAQLLNLRHKRLIRFNGVFLTHKSGGYYCEIDDELVRAEIRQGWGG